MKFNLENFIPHLNVYSEYNFLSSFVRIDDYISFLKKNHFTSGSVVTVDHLFGTWEFYKKCHQQKIKPIIGLSLSNAFFGKNKVEVTFFPKNFSGYQNLVKISSKLMTNEDHFFSFEENIQLLKNIFIVYSNITSFDQTFIDFLEENNLFFYIGIKELEKKFENSRLQILEKGIPFCEIRYLNDLEKNSHNDFTYQILCAIKKQQKISLQSLKKTQKTFSLKEKDFIDSSLKKIRNNLQTLVNSIDLKLPLKWPLNLKKIVLPKDFQNSFDYLKFLCEKTLQTKKLLFPKYHERLFEELKLIKLKGLVNYFLIVKDYVDFAYQKNILLGPGRGSAAGSLVAYLLNITKIDPLKYNLLFARFLNLHRVEMPDIDLDFEDQRREEIFKYLFQKYGKEHVAQITTFVRIGIKTALRDVGRILNLSLKDINFICKKIPLKLNISFLDFVKNDHVLNMYFRKYPDLFFYAEKIVMLPRQTGIHAAGIVISDQKLHQSLATWKGSEKYHVLQLEMNYLDDFGLVKMDLLALKNLSLIANIIQEIDSKINKNHFLANLNFDDQKTFALLSRGETKGIFQLESKGMTNLIKKIKPQNLDDISNVISLFRPSAMQNINLFLKRRNDKNLNVNYYCKEFISILKKTYGIPIYQEQIIEMIHIFAGLSIDESDLFRKAISKKNLQLIKKMEVFFIKKAKLKNHSLFLIKTIWNLLLQFANYGFNRSHGISYSVIVYWMAYLKTHYFSKYILFLLNDVIRDKEKTFNYLSLMRKKNLQLLPISINDSTLNYKLKENNKNCLIPPLTLIKQIRSDLLKKIIFERQKNGYFKDFYDFIARSNLYHLDKITYQKFIDVGACDFFGYNRKTLKENLQKCLKVAMMVKTNEQQIDWNFFEFPKKIIVFEEETQQEIWKKEISHLGLILNWDKFRILREKTIQDHKNILLFYLDKLNDVFDFENKIFPVFVLILEVEKTTTKKGETIFFLKVCDQNDVKKIIISKVKFLQNNFAVGKTVFIYLKIKKYYQKKIFIFVK